MAPTVTYHGDPAVDLPNIKSPAEARDLLELDQADLCARADGLRRAVWGDGTDLCSIVNARSGACSEDCRYCAQSARYRTGVPVYDFIDTAVFAEAARAAAGRGARRFCTVTSGRRVAGADVEKVGALISASKDAGLHPCATLGLMEKDDLKRLQDRGLSRYHHNLETSERFFPSICTTHTFADKIRTIEAASSLGLSVCSGGIFGLGESWDDRISMAFALRDLPVDSVPLNFLTPVKGTPLSAMKPLSADEALRIVALYRILLPDREIRLCGGRPGVLGDRWPEAFAGGANGLLVGNYLTTLGPDPDEDVERLRGMGRAPLEP